MEAASQSKIYAASWHMIMSVADAAPSICAGGGSPVPSQVGGLKWGKGEACACLALCRAGSLRYWGTCRPRPKAKCQSPSARMLPEHALPK